MPCNNILTIMEIHSFPTLPSTSTYIADNAASLPSGYVVETPCQTAGRGQRGNSWESEPGKNITFSMIMRMPGFAARRQFRISEAVSLAIIETVMRHTGVACSVKWPNDIYAGDRKLCGILISHSLAGDTISYSIIGAGININQTCFLSDAPNPVSAAILTGREYDVGLILRDTAAAIEASLCRLASDPGYEQQVHERYMDCLWRADGTPHPFQDAADGTEFLATVYAVEPLGHLVLRQHPCGTLRRYAFKEVVWL